MLSVIFAILSSNTVVAQIPKPKCKVCQDKTIDDCPYKGNHPDNAPKLYDVSFFCNVNSVQLIMDGKNMGLLKNCYQLKEGKHSVILKAKGYEDFSRIILVNEKNKSFDFDLISNKSLSANPVLCEDFVNSVYVDIDTTIRENAEHGDSEALFDIGNSFMEYVLYVNCVDSIDSVRRECLAVEACRWYRKAAQRGNASAMANLGECYSKGVGVQQDDDVALDWFLKAAQEGNVDAMRYLGSYYLKGDSWDEDEAIKWYRKAALEGDVFAMWRTGDCYSYSNSVSEAVNWYRKAAEEGDATDKYILATRYYRGKGVPKDYAEAIYWYQKATEEDSVIVYLADEDIGLHFYEKDWNSKVVRWFRKVADEGDLEAQKFLCDCYYNGKGVSTDFLEAVKWCRKAACYNYWGQEYGDALSQYYLGNCYFLGQGVPKNYEEAIKWFSKAAEQGINETLFLIGNCYSLGLGNYSEAVKWYLKAAGQGDSRAMSVLGDCYNNGKGVTVSCSEALRWYNEAAIYGDVSSICKLGDCYSDGGCMSLDYKEAVKWYQIAAEKGNSDAQNKLGDCYYHERGVKRDYSEAVKWYREAAEQGNVDAQMNLGDCYKYGRGVPRKKSEAKKWYQKAGEQTLKEASLQ